MIPSISSRSLLASTLLAGVIDSSSAAPGPSAVDNRITDSHGLVRCGVPNVPVADLMKLEEHFENQRVALGGNLAIVGEDLIDIDLYLHVVAANKTAEGGYVSESQINEQINVLNIDYGNMGIRFGRKEVTWTTNEDWFHAKDDSKEQMEMKQQLRQGGPADLNVFINCVGCRNLLGYATFPHDYSRNPVDDGVVVRYSSLPGGNDPPYDKGRTLTHEVGHWLGLYHTFQGGCDGPGDLVDDTPYEASPAFGCPIGRRSCSFSIALDPIHNFMDYVDDDCMENFTPSQGLRVRAQLAIYRNITGATRSVPGAKDGDGQHHSISKSRRVMS